MAGKITIPTDEISITVGKKTYTGRYYVENKVITVSTMTIHGESRHISTFLSGTPKASAERLLLEMIEGGLD